METKTIQIYTFEELSKEAQEKAISDYREEQDILLDFFEDYCHEKLEENGFGKDLKVYYSLNYCQGDGLCFEGKFDICEYLEKNKLKTRFKKLWNYGGNIRIKHVGHYYHYNSMEIIPIGYEGDDDELGQIIKNHVKSLSKELAKLGYEEIEYQQSDDIIRELLICNEYNFLKDGKTEFMV